MSTYERSWRRRFSQMTPVRLLAVCFLAQILVGGVVLWLPISTKRPISFVDAMFTATSATCVTGLITVDPGTTFTAFGQAVILCLIQAGGLGIMMTSTVVLLALGQRAYLRNLTMVRDEYTVSGAPSLRQVLLAVGAFTFVVEAAGALALTARFNQDMAPGAAAWCGVFHSVSAFCNAGFSLFERNLMGYRGDATINVVVPLLIIFGGVGFPAWIDLFQKLVARLRGFRVVLSLHAKIVFVTTAVLLVVGTAGFFVLEGAGQLVDKPFGERLAASWFQSTTTRTAGFNTIDFGQASGATLLLAIVLMMVGGSPGSTAGGIKTTTAAVIALVVGARVRGRGRVEVGKRTIPVWVITKALVVAVLGVVLVVFATGLLLVTDGRRVEAPAAHGSFVSLLFETVSAFGTVGLSVLSTAASGGLTWGGKLVIMCVMYAGKLGPLALAQLVVVADRALNYKYPEESLLVG